MLELIWGTCICVLLGSREESLHSVTLYGEAVMSFYRMLITGELFRETAQELLVCGKLVTSAIETNCGFRSEL